MKMKNKENGVKIQQDYRVICLYSKERQTGFAQRDVCGSMLSYYDEISVKRVEPEENMERSDSARLTLRRAHEIAHQIIRNEQNSCLSTQTPIEDNCIRFPQVLIAFTDYLPDSVENDSHSQMQTEYYTQKELDAFWNNTTDPLFFVSMIHLGEQVSQSDFDGKIIEQTATTVKEKSAERHASAFAQVLSLLTDRSKFPTEQFLAYFSFDHSDLILFGRMNSFHDYAKKIFELDYASQGLITDSITLWSFQYLPESKDSVQANMALDQIIKQSAQRFTAHFRFGVRNYRQAKDFVCQVQANDSDNITSYCSLGRNDMSLLNHNANLVWIAEILQKLSKSDWCNTYDLCLLLPDLMGDDFAGHTASPFSKDDTTIRALGKRLMRFENTYREGCNELNIQPDETWLRWLSEAVLQASSFLRNKMSANIGICLTPQIRDLLTYGERLFNAKEKLRIEYINRIRFCFEQFFSNVLILIDSMNHSNRQFVQSPAFHVAAFEMPPKIMAYYTAVTSKLSHILALEEDLFCGYTISPKFANALYVTSLAVQEVLPAIEYISIAVDENSLYDLRLTTQTLAHELSHFVGGQNRCRALRTQKLCLYVLCRILQSTANRIFEVVLSNNKIISFELIRKCAETLYDVLISRYSKFKSIVYLRDTFHCLKQIPVLFCLDYTLQQNLYNSLVNMIRESSFSDFFIINFSRQVYEKAGLTLPQKDVNWLWEKDPLLGAELQELFSEKLQYLKQTEDMDFADKWKYDPLLGEASQEELPYLVQADAAELEDKKVKPLHPYWQACYLFRETFADLQMILLFDMDMKEYLDIVLPAKTESKPGDLNMRILAVAFVMAYQKGALSEGRHDWSSSTLKERLGLPTNYNFEQDIDTMMMGFLTEYLGNCSDKITQSFAKNPKIRETIESISRCFTGDAARTSQEAILELICSYHSEMLQNCQEYLENT